MASAWRRSHQAMRRIARSSRLTTRTRSCTVSNHALPMCAVVSGQTADAADRSISTKYNPDSLLYGV
eukprot:1627276-Rhodomonas_salina.1